MTTPAPIPPEPRRRRFESLNLPVRIGLVLGLVLLALGALRSTVVEWNDVPSPSMRPTILEGDRIVVSRMAYDVRVPFLGWRAWRRADPGHGDLVVYVGEDGQRVVKRVIGVPGDRISVRDHRVIRNGIALTQASGSFVVGPAGGGLDGRWIYGEDSDVGYSVMIAADGRKSADVEGLTLKKDEYFVLGDNRSDSRDSREVGNVSREVIVGRAALVAFSRDAAGFRRGRFLLRLR